MLKMLGLLVVALAVMLRTGEALSCFPCYEIDCGATPDCNFGVGTDVCGCCPQCLQGPGDECGGPWGVLGDCAEDYTCQIEDEYDFNASGSCAPKTEVNKIRRKRGLANTRRAGVSRVQAKQHTHEAYGGVPKHIKARLRAMGVQI